MPSLVLLLGGRGTRFGSKKQFLTYRGRFLFEYLLGRVRDLFSQVVLVVPPEDLERFKGLYPDLAVTAGGSERQFSVYNGLKLVKEPVVVVHDGARPFASRALFERVLRLGGFEGKVPALPVTDTIKRLSPEGLVLETLPRKELAAVQTPQAFRTEVLKECHERALEENFLGTDDASLVERCGYRVAAVEGERFNFKITYPEDWETALCLLEKGVLKL
ncbi:MAG: 2-C-methyl-D-erythritol 4-phosphate cytidylyltransferase [Aquificae bacterium]|nr:2-C-methyl-D-erythritol 4-phosphate cytidylyltransferase [Aquificota bacterium]